MKKRILIVEPDPDLCHALSKLMGTILFANAAGDCVHAEVLTASSRAEALRLLGHVHKHIDLMITNLHPDDGFVSFVRSTKTAKPAMRVLLFTGGFPAASATEAVDATVSRSDEDHIKILKATIHHLLLPVEKRFALAGDNG